MAAGFFVCLFLLPCLLCSPLPTDNIPFHWRPPPCGPEDCQSARSRPPLRWARAVAEPASRALCGSTSACARGCVPSKPRHAEPFPRTGGRGLVFSLPKQVLRGNRSVLVPQRLFPFSSALGAGAGLSGAGKNKAQSKETGIMRVSYPHIYSVCVHALMCTRIHPLSSTCAHVHTCTPSSVHIPTYMYRHINMHP